MNIIDKYCNGSELCLHCPKCGDLNTHLIGIESYTEKDDRLCVSLTFWCECGHKFKIAFNQHEGITFIDINSTDINIEEMNATTKNIEINI